MRAPRQPGNSEIAAWFLAQHFAPHSALPSERMLGELLGLSRFQIRQGLAELAAQGLLEATRDGWRMSATDMLDFSRAIVVLTLKTVAPSPGEMTIANQSPRIWQGMETAAQAHGVRLVTVLATDFGPPFVRRLMRQRPLGVVFLHDVVESGMALPVVQAAWSAEIPCVALGDWIRPDEIDRWPADVVLSDHAGGIAALVHWLHARGVRRPWMVGWREQPPRPPSLWWNARLAGYAAACSALNLTVAPTVEPFGISKFSYDEESLIDQARILAGYILEPLESGADAFLMMNDGPALIIGRALQNLKKIFTHNVQTTGFDNCLTAFPATYLALCGKKPVATFDKDESANGVQIIELLLQRIAGRLPSVPQRVLVPGRVVECEPSKNGWL